MMMMMYNMLEYTGMCHFPGYMFCPKFLGRISNLKKVLKQSNILLGNRPDFFRFHQRSKYWCAQLQIM